jgi:tRNA/rRNA methyltransferase
LIPGGTSITLVEPNYPVNVGHTARLVKNFGVKKLYLVRPKVDMSVAAIYAAHASDVLDSAIVTDFRQVRDENDLLVATTAVRASKSNVIRRTVAPARLHTMLSGSQTSSLVFGRDTTGLTNAEIRMCDATTSIDTASSYRALNLGHAVAIILYLASRGHGSGRRVQSRKSRETFAGNLRDLAAAANMPLHKVEGLFEAGKRVASTSGLTDAQLNLLGGVMKKALSALEPHGLGSKT